MKLWNKIKIDIVGGRSTRDEVTAFTTPLCPGLSAHRRRESDHKKWVITHIKSGLAVVFADNKKGAVRMLLGLGQTKIDWTLCEDKLAVQPLRKALNEARVMAALPVLKQRTFA